MKVTLVRVLIWCC